MTTENNNQEVTVTPENGGEGNAPEPTEVKLSKTEYDSLKALEATVGSLKRELKDFKKPADSKIEKTTATPSNQNEEFGLLQKTYLASRGITAEDELELARDIQKRTGLDWDKLPDNKYFQSEMQVLRDAKANAIAVDVGEGGSAPSNAKSSPEFYIKRGTPPTASEVPDRKTRANIARAMASNEKNSGGKFYNEGK